MKKTFFKIMLFGVIVLILCINIYVNPVIEYEDLSQFNGKVEDIECKKLRKQLFVSFNLLVSNLKSRQFEFIPSRTRYTCDSVKDLLNNGKVSILIYESTGWIYGLKSDHEVIVNLEEELRNYNTSIDSYVFLIFIFFVFSIITWIRDRARNRASLR